MWSCTCRPGACPDLLPTLLAAGCRVVVDHFGRPDPALGVRDPGFGYLLQQAGSGRVWVKLSAPYRIWPAADCAASGRQATAQLLQAFAAERLLWGSDWPHTQHAGQASYPATVRWMHDWLDPLDDAASLQVVLGRSAVELFRFPSPIQTQGDTP